MINVYKPDGTEEGFFTAVFNAYPDKNAFIGGKDYITPLTDKEIPVVTDPVKAARVKNRLKIYDDASLRDIDYILRSDGKDKENVAFRYIRRICAEKCPVRKRFADRDVLNALRLIKKYHGNGIKCAVFSGL